MAGDTFQGVFPYWGSVWYEKVTEDEYQSGGHCSYVALSLALGRSRFRYSRGGLPADFNATSCRLRIGNVLKQMVVLGESTLIRIKVRI